jgi:hypothetical protein
MYLVISNCVAAVKNLDISGHYLRNRSTLNIGVLGYIGILQHKEHSPEVWHILPGTLCILEYSYDARIHEGKFFFCLFCLSLFRMCSV